MANNVTNRITIHANDDAVNAMEQRFLNSGGYADVNSFVKAFYDEYETSEDGNAVLYSWTLDYLGAKWVYFEDQIDSNYFNIQSASYPPHEFLQHLYNLVTEIDPEGYLEVEYEDEGYEPVGVILFKKDSNGEPRFWTDEEYDWENPADDMDYDDEGYDDANMEFYDSIAEYHAESMASAHHAIDNGEGQPFKLIREKSE